MAALDFLKLAPRGRFLLAWVALGLSVSSHSQVSWSVDTTQIQWGEPVQLTAEWLLTMTDLQSGVADADAWPAWTDTTNAGLEILTTSQVDTLAAPLDSEADVLLTKTWTLTSWDSGFVVLTPERFGPHETSPLLLRVLTPDVAEDAQPMPPADIVAVEWTLMERLLMAWPWFAGILLAIALFFVGRAMWRQWRRPEVPASPSTVEAPTEPPHLVALRVLNGLLQEQGWTQGRGKEAQATASLAVRRYIEGRFGVPAAERTTGDLAALLPASAIPKTWQTRLMSALEQADAVKFAKGQLPDLTHRSLIEAYIEFVNDTREDEHEGA